MFQETTCKEENPGVFPLFAYALQEYGKGRNHPTRIGKFTLPIMIKTIPR
jgi:hypothetical protein